MTGTTVLKLTRARRRALEVIARAPRSAARESNGTSDPTPLGAPAGGDPTIYWQSRAWLCDNGLIEPLRGQSNWYQLTAAGVGLVDQLGLGVVDGPAAAKATSSTAAAGAAADGLGEAGIAVTLGAESWRRVIEVLDRRARRLAQSGLGEIDATIADSIAAQLPAGSVLVLGGIVCAVAEPADACGTSR